MPYVIAIVIVIIAGVAFTLFQSNKTPESTTVVTTETSRTPENELAAVNETIDTPPPVPPTESNTDTSGTFKDGTYTVQTSYFTPRRTEHLMDVTLILKDGVVADARILWDGAVEPKTPSHSGFDAAYKAEVIGKSLESINLSRVGGASLTSTSFNEAVDKIEVQARAS